MNKIYTNYGIGVYKTCESGEYIAIDESVGTVLFIFRANKECVYNFETTSSYCYANRHLYDEILNAILDIEKLR